jgi:hypothetical protein
MEHLNLMIEIVLMKKLKAHAYENNQSVAQSARQALRLFLGVKDPYGAPEKCLACSATDALQIHPINKETKYGAWACNKCFSSGRYFDTKEAVVLMNMYQDPS